MAASSSIFPSPKEAHVDCLYCDAHYLTIEAQLMHGRRYNGIYNDTEAQSVINHTTEATTKSLETVKNFLKTHGNLTLERWSKKTKKQRGLLLSTTAKSVFGEWDPISLSLSKDQSWIWGPWLTPSEFAEDRMRLLSLLHVQTVIPPKDWLAFDTIHTATLLHSAETQVPYNEKYVQLYGDKYGRLTVFDVDLVHARAVLGFPRAFYAFNAQKRVASMLESVVHSSLAEAALTGNTQWTAAMSSRLQSGEAAWNPYTSPGLTAPSTGLDTKVMLQASRDRFNKIVDDIEILQTDPEYMRNYALTTKANIRWDADVPTALKWDYVSESIIFTWIHSLSMWHNLYDACQRIHDACEQHDGSAVLQPGVHLSLEASEAFNHLGNTLMHVLGMQTAEFETALQDMREMKSFSRKVITQQQIYSIEPLDNTPYFR